MSQWWAVVWPTMELVVWGSEATVKSGAQAMEKTNSNEEDDEQWWVPNFFIFYNL